MSRQERNLEISIARRTNRVVPLLGVRAQHVQLKEVPMMTEQFDHTAVKLSQGPLGIIALFIVLIHGFASLVLGLATNIGESNRSILVWFLVLFPVGVFAVFAWLVSKHHIKLYPPQAFRHEEYFFNLAYGHTSFDEATSRPRRSEAAETPAGVIKATATGSLYWLGHDLMWTADTLLRAGPREHVLIGLDQALHHLSQVGLGETPVEAEILRLQDRIRQSKELPPSLRDEYANQLGSIIDRIGAAAEAAQGDFQVPPHWTRIRESARSS